MSRTFLEMMQTATAEITAIERPLQLFGTENEDSALLIALANREATELAERETKFGGWQRLQQEATIITAAGSALYDLPVDYGFSLLNTERRGDDLLSLHGPLAPSEFSYLKRGVTVSGSYFSYRIRADKIELWPVPTADGTALYFDYVSNRPVLAADNVSYKQRFDADTDMFILDEDILIMGVKRRLKQAMGLDSSVELADYQDRLSRLIARDGGTVSIDLRHNMRGGVINGPYTPETGIGS